MPAALMCEESAFYSFLGGFAAPVLMFQAAVVYVHVQLWETELRSVASVWMNCEGKVYTTRMSNLS